MEYNYNKLISIIVPVYKVEEYLPKCVESLLKQTYKNLEIILVDDGSPDRCPSLCDEYALQDSRIKVVHKENGGLADARNAGIDIMSGEYVTFVDSDDYIHPQMVELLFKAMEQEKSDVAVSSWESVTEHDEKSYLMYAIEQYTNFMGKEIQEKYLIKSDDRITFTVAWAKLYKSELFQTIRYPKGKLHEDEYTTYKVLYKAERITYVDVPLYFYLTRESSIMGAFNARRFDIFGGYLERVEFYLQNKEEQLAKRTLFLAIHMLTQYHEWIKNENKECAMAFREYKQIYQKKCREYMQKQKLTVEERVELKVFSRNFICYKCVWNMRGLLRR